MYISEFTRFAKNTIFKNLYSMPYLYVLTSSLNKDVRDRGIKTLKAHPVDDLPILT
mgnify:CR=1 FL=1